MKMSREEVEAIWTWLERCRLLALDQPELGIRYQLNRAGVTVDLLEEAIKSLYAIHGFIYQNEEAY